MRMVSRPDSGRATSIENKGYELQVKYQIQILGIESTPVSQKAVSSHSP